MWITNEKESHVDVALQLDTIFRRQKRLVVFDMDSTLIYQECIDELAREAGVYNEIAPITESAMRGEIDFNQSLRKRVGLLKGQSVDLIETVKNRITFTKGAKELCKVLKRLGYKLAVLSGGFIPMANLVKNTLDLDYAFANVLEISKDGKTLTGNVVGEIVNGERKAELLSVIAQAEKIESNQIFAIGDGANDLLMMRAAGCGIAFNAKPKVQQQASIRLNQPSLINVLYFLGYSSTEINQLLQ
ncbi:HAD-like domain-containing protein [Globomyces pollinis-pini]|nr:HAD-like domain-containing protein [Globomyces pollinis-pini]